MTAPFLHGRTETAFGPISLNHLPPLAVFDELQAEGIAVENIQWALATQQLQRGRGLKPKPLRVILGLDALAVQKPFFAGLSFELAEKLAATKPAPKSKGGLHITRRPVHANSVQAGSAAEADFVRPLREPERKELAKAVYATLDKAADLRSAVRTGQKEALSDEEAMLCRFTRRCRDTLRIMLDEEKHWKGWVMPCYETLAKKAQMSRATVHRALQDLAALGIVSWIRRFNYTKDEILGARSEQTSNLYRIQLPLWLRKVMGKVDAPLPDDFVEARQTSLESFADMLATLTAPERRRAMPAEASDRKALLAAAISADLRRAGENVGDSAPPLPRRGSQKPTAPPPIRYYSLMGDKELP